MNHHRRRISLRLVILLVVVALLPLQSGAARAQNVELSVWSYLAPDDPAIKTYIERFQEQNPTITINYTAYPEAQYQDKVRTALTAGSPPDIAIIEDRAWMKAGLVVELSDDLAQWGIDPADFNVGGIARAAPEGDIAAGIYGVGDFLGGNVLFYNKALFDQAGLPYPSTTQSLTWTQYADICRRTGHPDRNPANAVYGCSVQPSHFDIWARWAYGDDGRTVTGNLNSEQMVQAWNLGTGLVRDGYAPSTSVLQTVPAGESDLFAQGKIAITWSDFTEVAKYEANGIDFGMAPFYVLDGSESFVDTWTSPWGTFTGSAHPQEALSFLRFIATDAQYIRTEVSADPPLSNRVAQEVGWGQNDPVSQEYLTVLQQAKPQVFVPQLPEGAYDSAEIFRLMTVERQEDARPLLDAAVATTQPLLDQAWLDWEALAPPPA